MRFPFSLFCRTREVVEKQADRCRDDGNPPFSFPSLLSETATAMETNRPCCRFRPAASFFLLFFFSLPLFKRSVLFCEKKESRCGGLSSTGLVLAFLLVRALVE